MTWYSFIQKYFGYFFAVGLGLGFFCPVFFAPLTSYVILILATVMTFTFLTIDFRLALDSFKSFHKIAITLVILKVVLNRYRRL